MSRPEQPCGDCACYVRRRSSGPPTSGTCWRGHRGGWVHANERGCTRWIEHATTHMLRSGGYIVEGAGRVLICDGARLAHVAGSLGITKTLDLIGAIDPTSGMMLSDLIALGEVKV